MKKIPSAQMHFLLTINPLLVNVKVHRPKGYAGVISSQEGVFYLEGGSMYTVGEMEQREWKKRLAGCTVAALIVELIVFGVIILGVLFGQPRPAHAQELTASWYSVASCLREGTSGIMANGRRLNDAAYVCASWDHPFGTRLLVTNIANNRSVVVVVSDRGPAKKLYRKGRVIDLSKGAFAEIANLKQGVIKITVEVIHG
jgi:hypothetical protein